MLSKEIEELGAEIVDLLCDTGRKLVELRLQGRLNFSEKSDGSLICDGDILSDDLIRGRLLKLLGIPYISEEGNLEEEPDGVAEGLSWVVDPLDGTSGYVRGRDEFTINVALLERRRPILGVIHVPMQGESVQGWIAEDGERGLNLVDGGEGNRDLLNDGRGLGKNDTLRVVCSRSRSINFLRDLRGVCLIRRDASSKFVSLLKGEAEVYAQLGETRVWDTVAAQVMVENCGGGFWNIDGTDYQITDCLAVNRPFFATKTIVDRDLFLEKMRYFGE